MVYTPWRTTSLPLSDEDAEFLYTLVDDTEDAPWMVMSTAQFWSIAAAPDGSFLVSPVTADHVNPERPWPDLDRLREVTEARGFALAPRLTIYPEFVSAPGRD